MVTAWHTPASPLGSVVVVPERSEYEPVCGFAVVIDAFALPHCGQYVKPPDSKPGSESTLVASVRTACLIPGRMVRDGGVTTRPSSAAVTPLAWSTLVRTTTKLLSDTVRTSDAIVDGTAAGLRLANRSPNFPWCTVCISVEKKRSTEALGAVASTIVRFAKRCVTVKPARCSAWMTLCSCSTVGAY